MKFLHTGDWHLGRKLNGFSLLAEQEQVFKKMIAIAEKERVDGIIIAGDIYDRSIPSIDAVQLFHDMMIEMNLEKQLPVFAISGNHDSSIRLDVGTPWLKTADFYLNTRLEQAFTPIEYGNCQLYLLPYFEPFHARQYFEQEDIRTIQQAMPLVIEEMRKTFKIDKKQLLVSHFFVSGSEKSASETTLEVGGLDNVSADNFSEFDYVALGHLHYYDALKNYPNIAYSGALLKYSLSEVNQSKGVRIVNVTASGVDSKFSPIIPTNDVFHLTDSFDNLLDETNYPEISRQDYVGITLTDTTLIDNSMNRLRENYPKLISLDRLVSQKKDELQEHHAATVAKLSPEKLTTQYFEQVVGRSLTVKQQEWLDEATAQTIKER
ncbi:exonuclease SbcCD subunit D [Vagococcus vulneris]|uniref:Nuclease SbcCD subunit D n=1 Tax=Vagococcus vulneris TaxID=1977869 RepID=A0A429ZV38_9ENTE|nr:exonuclease SbcCD subunit D [Vagococcus vulneris]RST97622.1 exonuclease sbcCD subunit D [Vagococcus vulneris]